MSEPTAVPPGLLAAMLDEQRRAWRNGERKLVESFLLRVPELSRDHTGQLDLIYNEIVLREEAGERPLHQEYLQRFPDLREELAIQFEVDRALNLELLTAEQKPPAAPFAGMRFPSPPGYETIGILGRGKRGLVYKARHVASGRLDALKIILSGSSAGAVRSFHTEVNAWMKFKNQHIISILEISVHDGRIVVAMELLERSLANRIAGNDPVPPRQAAEWLEKLARTIHEVHQRGLTHRNLKASNVLLGPDGALKLTDFGMEASDAPTERTPGWLPEEPAVDALPRGVDADVTALGVILYEMLTGKPPGSFESPPKLPRDLEAICQNCLDENPRRRYASAAALAADLSAYLRGERVRAPRARRRNRSGAGGAKWLTIATIALIAFGLSLIWLPISAAALPAALAFAVFGFALGSWWSDARVRRQILQMQEEQRAAQRKSLRLAMLFDLSNRLTRLGRAEEILPLVVETAVWLVDAEQAVLFHVDADRRELWAKSNGIEVRVPIGGGIVGAVAKMGEPIGLADPFADARFDAAVDGCVVRKPRSLAALPIRDGGGAVIGVLMLVNKRQGIFENADVEVLMDFLGAVAATIEKGLEADSRPA